MVERVIRVGAFDKRYSKGGIFYSLPFFDPTIDNYRTGQEKNEKNPEGLSKKQIEGTEPLNDQQKKKYPDPIIIEGRGIPISRHTKFILTQDAKDNYINPRSKALYDYFLFYQDDIIASSKAKAIEDKHLFYFIDVVAESEFKNNNRKLIRNLENKVFENLDESSYYELLLYTNFHTTNNYPVNNVSFAILEDSIYEIVQKHPNVVEKFFSPVGKEELFILKLVFYGIITVREGAFFDNGDKHIGVTISDVLAHIKQKDGRLKAISWQKALMAKDVRYAKYAEEVNEKLKQENKGNNPGNEGNQNP